MKRSIGLGIALLSASLSAQTPAPTPAAPGARAAAPSPTPHEDPIARERKEPPKEALPKTGKGANEVSKESKTGSDTRMIWASNRIERDQSNAKPAMNGANSTSSPPGHSFQANLTVQPQPRKNKVAR